MARKRGWFYYLVNVELFSFSLSSTECIQLKHLYPFGDVERLKIKCFLSLKIRYISTG